MNVRKVKEVALNTAICTIIVISTAIMVLCTGCQAVKGGADDIAWTADKLSEIMTPAVQKMQEDSLKMEMKKLRRRTEFGDKLAQDLGL